MQFRRVLFLAVLGALLPSQQKARLVEVSYAAEVQPTWHGDFATAIS